VCRTRPSRNTGTRPLPGTLGQPRCRRKPSRRHAVSEWTVGRAISEIRPGAAFKFGAAFAAGWVIVSTILTPILWAIIILIVLVVTGVWP